MSLIEKIYTKSVSARRGFVQIIIVTVIALAFGAAAIFGYQKFLKKSPAVGQKIETQASPSVSADETAKWKTYNAADFVTTQNPALYHFSIKYPPDWQSKAFLYFMSPDFQAPLNAQDTVFKGAFIQVQASQAYTESFPTLMDWFNDFFKDPRSSGPPPDNPTPITLNIGSLGKIDGLQYDQEICIQAPKPLSKCTADSTGKSLTKLFVHNNVMYHFILTSEDDPIKYMPILDDMISAFKLTSNETANWKTYTNTKLGYSIKYPSTWLINNDSEDDVYIRNQNFATKESQAKPRYPKSGYPQDYIYIRILSNINPQEVPGYSKPIDWYKDLASKKGKVNDVEGTLDLNTVNNFSLGGKQSIVVKSSYDEVMALLLTPVDEDVHRILISPYEKLNDAEVSRILSTFKFTQ